MYAKLPQAMRVESGPKSGPRWFRKYKSRTVKAQTTRTQLHGLARTYTHAHNRLHPSNNNASNWSNRGQLLNLFIVHKSVVDKPLAFLHNRLAVVRYLTEGQCLRKKAGRPPNRPLAEADSKRLNGQYHSTAVEEKRRYCVVCAKYASVKGLSTNSISTSTVCTTCDRKPYMF